MSQTKIFKGHYASEMLSFYFSKTDFWYLVTVKEKKINSSKELKENMDF
jgi:hypothetical protein